jgi:hypothetical protein
MKYLFLFLSAISFAQVKTDLKLIESNFECGELVVDRHRIAERIIKSENINDTLSLELQYIENCGNRRIVNHLSIKDTIYLNFDLDNPIPASCNCVFNYKLKIINTKLINPVIKLKNFKGVRELKRSTNYYLPAEYKVKENDTLVVFDDQGYHYMRNYYDSGNIKLLRIRKDSYSERISYYENGMIKSISQSIGDINCYILKEWDINGKLINFIKSSDMDILFPKKSE